MPDPQKPIDFSKIPNPFAGVPEPEGLREPAPQQPEVATWWDQIKNPNAAMIPEAPQPRGMFDPLVDIGHVTGANRAIETSLMPNELAKLSPWEARFRGLVGGSTEAALGLASSMTSPVNAALQAVGLGGVVAARRTAKAVKGIGDTLGAVQGGQQTIEAARPLVSQFVRQANKAETVRRVASGTSAAAGTALGAKGAYEAMDSDKPASERLFGAAMAAGGAAMGVHGYRGARTPHPAITEIRSGMARAASGVPPTAPAGAPRATQPVASHTQALTTPPAEPAGAATIISPSPAASIAGIPASPPPSQPNPEVQPGRTVRGRASTTPAGKKEMEKATEANVAAKKAEIQAYINKLGEDKGIKYLAESLPRLNKGSINYIAHHQIAVDRRKAVSAEASPEWDAIEKDVYASKLTPAVFSPEQPIHWQHKEKSGKAGRKVNGWISEARFVNGVYEVKGVGETGKMFTMRKHESELLPGHATAEETTVKRNVTERPNLDYIDMSQIKIGDKLNYGRSSKRGAPLEQSKIKEGIVSKVEVDPNNPKRIIVYVHGDNAPIWNNNIHRYNVVSGKAPKTAPLTPPPQEAQPAAAAAAPAAQPTISLNALGNAAPIPEAPPSGTFTSPAQATASTVSALGGKKEAKPPRKPAQGGGIASRLGGQRGALNISAEGEGFLHRLGRKLGVIAQEGAAPAASVPPPPPAKSSMTAADLAATKGKEPVPARRTRLDPEIVSGIVDDIKAGKISRTQMLADLEKHYAKPKAPKDPNKLAVVEPETPAISEDANIALMDINRTFMSRFGERPNHYFTDYQAEQAEKVKKAGKTKDYLIDLTKPENRGVPKDLRKAGEVAMDAAKAAGVKPRAEMIEALMKDGTPYPAARELAQDAAYYSWIKDHYEISYVAGFRALKGLDAKLLRSLTPRERTRLNPTVSVGGRDMYKTYDYDESYGVDADIEADPEGGALAAAMDSSRELKRPSFASQEAYDQAVKLRNGTLRQRHVVEQPAGSSPYAIMKDAIIKGGGMVEGGRGGSKKLYIAKGQKDLTPEEIEGERLNNEFNDRLLTQLEEAHKNPRKPSRPRVSVPRLVGKERTAAMSGAPAGEKLAATPRKPTVFKRSAPAQRRFGFMGWRKAPSSSVPSVPEKPWGLSASGYEAPEGGWSNVGTVGAIGRNVPEAKRQQGGAGPIGRLFDLEPTPLTKRPIADLKTAKEVQRARTHEQHNEDVDYLIRKYMHLAGLQRTTGDSGTVLGSVKKSVNDKVMKARVISPGRDPETGLAQDKTVYVPQRQKLMSMNMQHPAVRAEMERIRKTLWDMYHVNVPAPGEAWPEASQLASNRKIGRDKKLYSRRAPAAVPSTTRSLPSAPAKPRGNVSSAIHPIGGAGYRAAESSTGKNITYYPNAAGNERGQIRRSGQGTTVTSSRVPAEKATALNEAEMDRDKRALEGRGVPVRKIYGRAHTGAMRQTDSAADQIIRLGGKVKLSDVQQDRAQRLIESMSTWKHEDLVNRYRGLKGTDPVQRYAIASVLMEQKQSSEKYRQFKIEEAKKRGTLNQLGDKEALKAEQRRIGALATIKRELAEGKSEKQIRTSLWAKFNFTKTEADAAFKAAASEGDGLTPPPSGGPRPLAARLRSETGAVGNADIGKLSAEQALEKNRLKALQRKEKPKSALTGINRALEVWVDRFQPLKVAQDKLIQKTGIQWPTGHSPLDLAHMMHGGGSGHVMTALIRMGQAIGDVVPKMDQRERNAASKALSEALSWKQISNAQNIFMSRLARAEEELTVAKLQDDKTLLRTAQNKLKDEQKLLDHLMKVGIGMKGAKITPQAARDAYQRLYDSSSDHIKQVLDRGIEQAEKEFRELTRFQMETGILSVEEGTRRLASGKYVGALYREMGFTPQTGLAAISAIERSKAITPNAANAYRQLLGIGEEHPLDSGMDNFIRTINKDYSDAIRARLMNSIVEGFGKDPDTVRKRQKDDQPVPENFVELDAYTNGVPESYFVHKDVGLLLLGSSPLEAQLAGLDGTWIQKINSFIARTGTAYSPGWLLVTNPPRDISAAVLGAYTPDGRPIYPPTLQDLVVRHTSGYWQNMMKVLHNHQDYIDYLNNEGGLATLNASISPEAAVMDLVIRDPKTGVLSLGPLAPPSWGAILKSWTRYSKTFPGGVHFATFINAMENAPKLMTYTRAIAMGVDPKAAAHIARNWGGTADLAQGGTAKKALGVATIYGSANIQERARWTREGLRTARVLSHNTPADDYLNMNKNPDGSYSFKDPTWEREFRKTRVRTTRWLTRLLASTTAMALGNAWWNSQFKDDQGELEINHVDRRMRNSHWITFIPQHTTTPSGERRWVYTAIPKETPQMLIAPLVVSLVGAAAAGDKDTAQRLLEEWFNAMVPGTAEADFSSVPAAAGSVARAGWSNVMPPIRAVVDIAADTALATGRGLTPRRLRDASTQMKFTAYTDPSLVQWATGITRLGLPTNPKYLEHLVRSSTGAIGSIGLGMQNFGLQVLGKQGALSKSGHYRLRSSPGLGVAYSRLFGPGEIDQQELDANDRFYTTANDMTTFVADTKREEETGLRSEFLKSKKAKIWEDPGKIRRMQRLLTKKGTKVNKAQELFMLLRDGGMSPGQQQAYRDEINFLHKEELDLLAEFDDLVLEKPAKLPAPPPSTGFSGRFDLRNRPK